VPPTVQPTPSYSAISNGSKLAQTGENSYLYSIGAVVFVVAGALILSIVRTTKEKK
jgi:LPXTG-motif cell wall-anchored protein